jgi:hypothetical protein
MALLSRLGLKPTREMLRRAAGAKKDETSPTEAEDISVDGAPPVGAPMKVKPRAEDEDRATRGSAARGDDPARAAVLALKPQLAQKERAARELFKRIGDAQAKLDKQVAAAQGTQKAVLQAHKKTLDDHAAGAEQAFNQARADLEAADAPGTRRDELVAILARAKSKAQIGELIEIEEHPGLPGGKLTERKEASTSTAYADGRAQTSKVEEKRSVGTDGVTWTKSQETETQTASGSIKTSNESKKKVGPGGYAREDKRSIETESGGKTVKLEKSSSTEVGADGAKRSSTVTFTGSDGASTSKTRDAAIERGDGKLGVSKGSSTTKTDAAGTEVKSGGSAKVGVVADGENYGGSTAGQRELSRKSKGGLATGVVGGLHSNLSCSIGEPKGQPPVYTLTLKVNLGGEITLSAGLDKKGAAAKGGFAFTGGADVFMTVEHGLDAAAAQEYVQALAEASAGSKAAATYKEFAIIHAGVNDGWHVAQAMWKGGGKPLSPQMLATLQRAGDSVELKTQTKAGAKLDADAKLVSVEAGIEKTSAQSTKVTRNDEGSLDVEVDNSEMSKGSLKLGVSLDGVGGSVGRARAVKTSFGYDITVDPKKDAQGQAVAALAGCSSAQDYEKFIAAHQDCIQVKSRKTGKALSDSEMVGLKLGGVEASIGLHAGVAEEKQVDADGKLISSTTVGSAGAGGGVKGGDATWGDSVEEQAVARRDGEGNASLDLTRTASATRLDKMADWVKSKLPFGGDDEKDAAKKKGALATAAGAKEEVDTQSHDVFGLRLANKDLDVIGRRAANETDWMHAAQRTQELDDWRAAGRKIRAAAGDRGVVADELARFIGGDKIHRLAMVKHFLRPGGDVSLGKAYGFPDSLKTLRKDFEALVVKPCEEEIREVVATQGAQKAGEFGQKLFDRVEALRQAVSKASDFRDQAAQAEMLSDLAHRKTAITAVMREVAGKNSDADKKAAAEEAFGRLMRECHKYSTQQNELFESIKQLLGKRDRILTGDFKEADSYLSQLLDLRAIWKRDLQEATALAKANGIPERRYQDCQPNDAEFVRLKKACLQPNR